MAFDSGTKANDGFLTDADAVVAGRHQKLLADIVGRLAGRGGQRRAAYDQIKPFMDDFQKWPSGEDRKPNEILTEMLKWLRHERIEWPIAPFLAWLCHYHKDEAATFYQATGLAVRHDFAYRPFAGRPGDRAKARKGGASAPPAPVPVPAVMTAPVASPSHYAARAAPRATTHLIERLRRDFIGRGSYLAAISRFVEERRAGANDGLLILKGPAGYGKSSLAAEWCGRNGASEAMALVAHFIAAPYPETLAFGTLFLHLAARIADLAHRDLQADHAREQLVDTLTSGLPDGRPLVIWIDGLDEAATKAEPFIPEHLHESVCLILSGRGGASECPPWLGNLISHPYVENYRLGLIDLAGFNDADMRLAADRIFARAGLPPMSGRELACLKDYSHGGLPMLVTMMATDAVDDPKLLRPWEATDEDLWIALEKGGKLNASGRFIARELEALKSEPFWKDYGDFFKLMTVLREPVTEAFLGLALDPAQGFTPIPSLELLPQPIKRWMDLSVEGDRKTICFSHSCWRDSFACLIDDQARYEAALCALLAGMNAATARYRAHWRIAHLCNTGQARAAYKVLRHAHYYSSLQALLGDVKALEQAVSDMEIFWRRGWMTFSDEADDIDDLLPDLIDTVHYHTRRLGVDPNSFAGGKPSYF